MLARQTPPTASGSASRSGDGRRVPRTDRSGSTRPAVPGVGRVLVVDGDARERARLSTLLRDAGFQVQAAGDGRSGLDLLDRSAFDVVLLDLHAPELSGLNVLSALPAVRTDARVIVMAESGTVPSAVEAMKLGAYDYISKPFRGNGDVHGNGAARVVGRSVGAEADGGGGDELVSLVRRAQRDARHGPSPGDERPGGIVGGAPVMERLLDIAARVARTRATVLVNGETGTGKELVARAIHELSDRSHAPFVAVNCSALPETLLESELFGHVKGAFTGALESRRGLVENAARGTLFLDEVSTLSPDVQVKLLRVIQDRRVQRIGSRSPVTVDFRLIAATNTDLAELTRRGEFREDLFYRLHVFPIRVPPLRERREDIPLLADHFRLRFSEENGVEPPELPGETLSRMMGYDWPGNVRELQNFIERAVILYAGGKILPFDLPGARDAGGAATLLERAERDDWTLDRLEREHVLGVLERTRGRQGAAAEILGVNRRTLYRKLKRYREQGLLPTAARIGPRGE